MKGLMLMIVAVAALALPVASGTAHAGCTAANRGGSAGSFDRGYTAFDGVEIYAEQYGSFASGPAYVCSNGDVGADAESRGLLEIRVDGELVCATSQRLSSDPFGFGSGVHSPETDACGAEISFDGVTSVFLPNPDDVRVGAEGADVSLRKETPVTGFFWFDGETYQVPEGATGYFTRGAKAASEH
jgi:hypothetical protein